MYDWSDSSSKIALKYPDGLKIKTITSVLWSGEGATITIDMLDKRDNYHEVRICFAWARHIQTFTQESDHLGIGNLKGFSSKYNSLMEISNSPLIKQWARSESIFEISFEYARHFVVTDGDREVHVVDTQLPKIIHFDREFSEEEVSA